VERGEPAAEEGEGDGKNLSSALGLLGLTPPEDSGLEGKPEESFSQQARTAEAFLEDVMEAEEMAAALGMPMLQKPAAGLGAPAASKPAAPPAPSAAIPAQSQQQGKKGCEERVHPVQEHGGSSGLSWRGGGLPQRSPFRAALDSFKKKLQEKGPGTEGKRTPPGAAKAAPAVTKVTVPAMAAAIEEKVRDLQGAAAGQELPSGTGLPARESEEGQEPRADGEGGPC